MRNWYGGSVPEPNAPNLATLLVSCSDSRGIVAALAQVLSGHGANILDADQHTDPVAGLFFQRIRFDMAERARTGRPSRAPSRRPASASK